MCHRLAHALKQGGIFPLHPGGVAGGALQKAVFGVLLHQTELVCDGARIFSHGLSSWPKPGGVHVGMPQQSRAGCAVAVAAGQRGGHDGARRAQALQPGLTVHGLWGEVQRPVHLRQGIEHAGAAEGVFVQHLGKLQQHAQVKQEIGHKLVLGADQDILCLEGEGLSVLSAQRAVRLKGRAAGHGVARIEFQRDIHAAGGVRLGAQHVAVVIAVARYDDFGGKGALRHAVYPEHGLIAAHAGHQIERPPCELFGGLIPAFEPAGLPRTAPMGDRRVEAFVGRHRAQVLPGLEHAVVELALGLEQVRLEYLQAMGQLLKQLFILLRVQHMPFPPYPPVLSTGPACGRSDTWRSRFPPGYCPADNAWAQGSSRGAASSSPASPPRSVPPLRASSRPALP